MSRARDLALVVETTCVLLKARKVLSRGLSDAFSAFDLRPVDRLEPAPVAGEWTADVRHLTRVVGVVLAAAPLRSTCLPTAVALARVLHRHGIAADVVIGVGSSADFSAHAWVELSEGRIDLAGHPLSAHTGMVRLRHRDGAVAS